MENNWKFGVGMIEDVKIWALAILIEDFILNDTKWNIIQCTCWFSSTTYL